ncbi:MAG: hypothetical protein FWG11_01385 [Promicromonosporaceae bacterium]|nr:hypothetical protein [Promicromonosporaceae bacterium]
MSTPTGLDETADDVDEVVSQKDVAQEAAVQEAELLAAELLTAANPVRARYVWKFLGFSLVGLALFLTPIPTGDGAFTIPLGWAADWLTSLFRTVRDHHHVNLWHLMLLSVVTVSALGALVAKLTPWEPRNQYAARAFRAGWFFLATRVIGAVIAWMIVFDSGPQFIIGETTGAEIMFVINALLTLFVFLAIAMPILTDFGVMEFLGALLSRVVRPVFTLPGRAAVDLAASWFGSSVASVLLTRNQHERKHYTGREAVVICTNFAFVSLPFSLVVAQTAGVASHFLRWYLLICAVCVLLGVITPRIWPLRGLSNRYIDGSEQGLIAEDSIPAGLSAPRWGLRLAAARAERTKVRDVASSGFRMYIDIYMDLIPIILGWGVLALAVFHYTDVFQWISTPMGWYMGLFGIEGAATYAPATLIGFVDMFVPALLVSGSAYLNTQLIISALAIVQIIYLTETGISILKSKMPISFGKLFAVFMIRTLIAIPLLTLGVWLIL